MQRRDAQRLHRPQCDKEPQAARRVSPSRVAELDEEDNPQDEDDDVRGRDEVRQDGEGVARERERHDQVQELDGVQWREHVERRRHRP